MDYSLNASDPRRQLNAYYQSEPPSEGEIGYKAESWGLKRDVLQNSVHYVCLCVPCTYLSISGHTQRARICGTKWCTQTCAHGRFRLLIRSCGRRQSLGTLGEALTHTQAHAHTDTHAHTCVAGHAPAQCAHPGHMRAHACPLAGAAPGVSAGAAAHTLDPGLGGAGAAAAPLSCAAVQGGGGHPSAAPVPTSPRSGRRCLY